jgi:hypothetical protein
MKPNCYDCRYRGTIPGDAHSRCLHPAIGPQDDNPFGAIAQVLNGEMTNVARELNVTAEPYGIMSGWFFWPANFDPTWLITCNGFEAKVQL